MSRGEMTYRHNALRGEGNNPGRGTVREDIAERDVQG